MSSIFAERLALFEKALNFVLKWEGGYVDHPSDPGGETNFGISKRAHPALDIKNLTRETAAQIYKTNYWDRCSCDQLPPALALAVFDTAVNCGPRVAIRCLQAALMVAVDGILGPHTLRMVNSLNTNSVLVRFMALRATHYVKIDTFDTFGLGWMRRLVDCSIAASRLL